MTRSSRPRQPCTATRAIGGRVNRYYDPATAQFLSVDPDVAETGEPYSFTADDPLNATDPLGLATYRPPRYWTRDSLPRVENRQLERSLRNIWKYDPEGHVGNGSSVAALEREAETGKPTEGSFHEESVDNDLRGLQKALRQNLNAGDRIVANDAYEYASQTLENFDSAVAGGRVQMGSGPDELSSARISEAVTRFQSYVSLTDIGADPGLTPPVPSSSGSGVAGEDEVPDVPEL
jgi:hypothetical protein